MLGPRHISEPHKELRFTRDRQAVTFFIVASLLLTGSLILVFLPNVHLAWSVGLVLLAAPVFYLAAFCLRHAYLILTPIGVEIFPFWRPAKNLCVIYWSEIKGVTVFDDAAVQIDFAHSSGGVVFSLSPLSDPKRELLKKALEGRNNYQVKTPQTET